MQTKRSVDVPLSIGTRFIVLSMLALFIAGCGGEEDPYAPLKEAYPEGRPGLASAEERAKDPEWMEKMSSEAARSGELILAVDKAKAAYEARLEALRALHTREGVELSDADVARAASTDMDAKQLQGALRAAEAALAAHQRAVRQQIRARMERDQQAYDAMAAEIEAKTGVAMAEAQQDVKAGAAEQSSVSK